MQNPTLATRNRYTTVPGMRRELVFEGMAKHAAAVTGAYEVTPLRELDCNESANERETSGALA